MQALKALVIVLGVLILVAAGAIAVTIYKRSVHGLTASPPATAQTEVHGAFGAKTIAIPAGAHVDDMTTSGDRLVVRLRLADGSAQVLVFDLQTGDALGELDFAPAAAQ